MPLLHPPHIFYHHSNVYFPQSRPSAALSSDVIRDLDVLRAESSARAAELQSLSAALEQMRSERDAFKSASEEAEEELKWYIGQLGALQKERNDEIILRWLQAAQGLSTIRAAGGGHLSSSRPAVPPHCRDPEQWLRGEALLGDLEAVTEAARSGRGGSEAERTAGPSNRTTAGCPDDAIGDLGVQPGAAPDPRVSTTSLQLPQSPPPLNRLGSMPVAFRDVLPTPGSQAALRDEPLGGPGGSSGRLAAMQAKIVELEAQQTAARGERAELLAELEKARAVASDAERRVGAAEESLRAAEARVAEAMQSTEEVRRVAATERDREVKALASRAQAAEDKVGRLEVRDRKQLKRTHHFVMDKKKLKFNHTSYLSFIYITCSARYEGIVGGCDGGPLRPPRPHRWPRIRATGKDRGPSTGGPGRAPPVRKGAETGAGARGRVAPGVRGGRVPGCAAAAKSGAAGRPAA